MTSPIAPLIDFIMELFRSPDTAQAFVANPDQAMRDAGLPNVNAAQLQAVAATAAPAGAVMGGGDPIVGLQRAVADHHSITSAFSPQTSFTSQPIFAPETNTKFASPDALAGGDVQQGGFNLGFGDITLGDKTTATHGSVIGDGTATTAGGDVIQDVDGPVIKEFDMSGGDDGGATAGGGVIIDPTPAPAPAPDPTTGLPPAPVPAAEPVPAPTPEPDQGAEDAAAQAAADAATKAQVDAQLETLENFEFPGL